MLVLANEYGVINFFQGFFNFEFLQWFIDLVCDYLQKGYNQYVFMLGLLELWEVIVGKINLMYGVEVDLGLEIIIIVGVIQAIYCVIVVFVCLGDEVFLLEFGYDCYWLVVEVNGGILVIYEFKVLDYKVNWDYVEVFLMLVICMIIINMLNNFIGNMF